MTKLFRTLSPPISCFVISDFLILSFIIASPSPWSAKTCSIIHVKGFNDMTNYNSHQSLRRLGSSINDVMQFRTIFGPLNPSLCIFTKPLRRSKVYSSQCTSLLTKMRNKRVNDKKLFILLFLLISLFIDDHNCKYSRSLM